MERTSIAIIAGGASRRMGEDKALLRISPTGPRLIEIVAAASEQFGSDRMVIAPIERGYGDLLPGWRVVPDTVAGAGPGAGMLTALESAREDRVLVLPCDAPLLSVPLLRFLIERCDGTHPVVPWRYGSTRQGIGPTLEVLHGVYPRAVLPDLKAMLDAGERQFFRIVERLDPVLIGPEMLSRFDPGLLSFLSLNTPADVASVKPELFARFGHGLY